MSLRHLEIMLPNQCYHRTATDTTNYPYYIVCPAMTVETRAYIDFLACPDSMAAVSNVQHLELYLGYSTRDQIELFKRATTLIGMFKLLKTVRLVWKADEANTGQLPNGGNTVSSVVDFARSEGSLRICGGGWMNFLGLKRGNMILGV